jgi:hypothetical protein
MRLFGKKKVKEKKLKGGGCFMPEGLFGCRCVWIHDHAFA